MRARRRDAALFEGIWEEIWSIFVYFSVENLGSNWVEHIAL